MTIVEKLKGKTVQLGGTLYKIVGANNGDENCISLSHPKTELFLRHKNGRIHETGANDNPKYFPMDSSFVPEEDKSGFVLHCSNQGMENKYICSIDEDTFIVNSDLDKYVFTLEVQKRSNTLPSSVSPIIGKSFEFNGFRYDIVPANNGDPTCISLRNHENNLYLRHKSNTIFETDSSDNPKFFPVDSSFVPEIRENGFILRCSNTGMKDYAVCQTPEKTLIVNRGLLEYIFHFVDTTQQDEDKFLQDYQFRNATVSYGVVQSLFQAASAISITNSFPVDTYLSDNTDAFKSNSDPIWHYVTQGFFTGFPTSASFIDPLILLHILSPENPPYSCLDYLQGIASDYVNQGLGKKLKDLLMTARIDILPVGTKEKPLKLIPEGIPEPFATFPKFMHKPEGNGCMIESNTLKTDCSFRCEQSGKVNFTIWGRDLKRRDANRTCPVWIRYERFEIMRNGEFVQGFKEPFLVTHDAAKRFSIEVADKDIIEVTAQWTPCFHSKRLLYTMMCSLDADVDEGEELARFAV